MLDLDIPMELILYAQATEIFAERPDLADYWWRDEVEEFISENESNQGEVSGGKLTDWTSLQLFGYQRLAARIEELRADGMRIKTQMISVSCRNGRIAKVAEYRMEEA